MSKQLVALVTGAASGIGRASALAFAKAGCVVVAADRNLEGLSETQNLVKGQGGTCRPIQLDVRDITSVQNMVKFTKETFGRLDYAHNNAGVMGTLARLHEYPEEEFDNVISVNLRGVFLCMKYQIPLMLETSEDPAIVLTSSTAGVMSTPFLTAYAASKHALLGMVKTAAREYTKIRITAVCPGPTATAMTAQYGAEAHKVPPEFLAELDLAKLPRQRIGMPDEIADAVVWMCMHAKYTTGTQLVVDGGLALR